MNTTTWYSLLVVIGISNVSAMELNRWDEKAKLLPMLSTVNSWPIPSTLLLGRPQQMNDPYKDAFARDDVQAALMAQAKVTSTRQEVRDGKTILQARSVFKDSRIPYALGVLSMQEGYTEEAIQLFMAAERAVGYKPHEMPVFHAASFGHFFLENRLPNAYWHMKELQKLLPHYPTFGDLLKVQCQLLVERGYQPMLKELAAEGSVDAQYEVVKNACHEAAQCSTVAEQVECLLPCRAYLEKLDAYPEFRPLLEVVTIYTKGVEGLQECSGHAAVKSLCDLLKEETNDASIQQVQQLSCNLLKALAERGDIFARSYFASQQVRSTTKSERVRGFEAIAKILEEKQSEDGSLVQNILDEFELRALIEPHAKNGQSVASSVWAQLTCHELLSKNVALPEEYEALKKYATNANTKNCTQKGLMCSILQFCELQLLLSDQKASARAAHKCIEIIKAQRSQSHIEQQILLKARTTLEELAQQNQLDAQTWQLAQFIQNDGQGLALQQSTVEYCLDVAKRLQEAPWAELLTDNGSRVLAALECITGSGTCLDVVDKKLIAEALYIKTRVLFYTLHVGREEIGLQLNQSKALDTVFLQAHQAARQGIAQAHVFARAIGLYRNALMLYDQKNDEAAVDKVLELARLDLPEREATLCRNFCRFALRIAAANGIHKAVVWHVPQLLEQKEYAVLFTEMTRAYMPLLQNVFAAGELEKWSETLVPYANAGIFDALVALEKQNQPTLDAARACFISMAHLVQALTQNRMLSIDAPEKEKLLERAMENAQEAYRLSCSHAELKELKSCYKNWLGVVCTLVGDYFADDKNFGALLFNDVGARWKNLDRAEQIFLQGAAVKHPQCITLAACVALDRPKTEKGMTQDDFRKLIKDLNDAVELGDRYAACRLAEHFFDGRTLPFGCGYSLAKDIPTAVKFAEKAGPGYSESKRIIAYKSYQSVAKNPKAPYAEKVLDETIKMLISVADAKYRPVYSHIIELVRLGICTEAQIAKIHAFLEDKVAQKVVDAQAAYGVILSADPSRIDQAIALLRDARELSNGVVGSAELLVLFAANPDKSFLLFEAVDAAVTVLHQLDSIEEIEKLGIFNLFALLHAAASKHEDQKEVIQQYSAKLLEAFRQAGINVEATQIDNDANFYPETSVVTQNNEQECACQVGDPVSDVFQLVTEKFLNGLYDMERSFQDMESPEAQRILKDAVLMEALDAAAKANNTLAQLLLSKVLLYEAEHTADLQEDIKLKRKQYRQALTLCTRLIMADPSNISYTEQFERGHAALCRFYVSTYIPALNGSLQELDTIFEEYTPFLAKLSEQHTEFVTNDQKYAPVFECVYALACNGCVPALVQYVDTCLKNPAKQQKALKAMHRCFLKMYEVYQERDFDDFQKSGLASGLEKTMAHIKELADKNNNAYAALVLYYWYSLSLLQYDAERTDIQLGEIMVHRSSCLEKAYKAGLPAAVYAWSKIMLNSSKTMSKKEFDQTLKVLENIAEKDVRAGELALLMCGSTTTFACGQKGLNDKKRGKKIALRIKDRSIEALAGLLRIAKEEKDAKRVLFYTLEMLKRTLHKPVLCYRDLAQSCVQANIYPDEIITYLQHQMDNGCTEAKLALACIGIKRKEFDQSRVLLDQVIKAGGNLAHVARLESALMYLDSKGSACNIREGFEQAKLGIQGLMSGDFAREKGIELVQALAVEIFKFVFESLMQQDTTQTDCMRDGLDTIIDLLANGYNKPSSLEWKLLMAVRQCNLGSGYWLLKREIDAALQMVQHSTTKETDKQHISLAVNIILSILYANAETARKQGNAHMAAESSAAVQDLKKLMDKNSIVYHMIIKIPLESFK